MRTFALALTALVLSGPVAFAQPADSKPAEVQPAAAELPSGESLFAKHVEAVGGLEGLRSQKSAMVKARINRPGSPSGLLTIWRKAPDKMYKIIDFPGAFTLETWCDGQNAWVRDSNRGTMRLSGDALTDTKLESDFVGEADFKSRYKTLTTKERTTFNGRPAYAVAATTISGKDRTLYFDAEKSFLIGVKLQAPLPGGATGLLTVALNDYKQFGVTWQPTQVVEDDGKIKTTTDFNDIKLDLEKMPSIDPPDDVKNAK
jgi:hypothetical protein